MITGGIPCVCEMGIAILNIYIEVCGDFAMTQDRGRAPAEKDSQGGRGRIQSLGAHCLWTFRRRPAEQWVNMGPTM